MKTAHATAWLAATLALAAPLAADELPLDPAVAEAEVRRLAVVKKITPPTIAIFEPSGNSGGSGVIVTTDGLALTNFHVVAPCGRYMKCGLPDGRLVDAVLVGLDAVGDIALVKLLSEKPDPVWPVAEWGDSDRVRVGDEAWVAGNPFLLAMDYKPTITHGIISGVGRYQYPAGTLLEYADCLQTDASINPGNSGGPLFDGQGRLIGINGRASFEKRGRVNVGVGYAVSANQVRRFLPHLAAGRLVDHTSLGVTFRTAGAGRVMVDSVSPGSDAYRRGLRYGDQIIRFAGRQVTSANQLQNTLGTLPQGWRAPLAWRRGYRKERATVRLERLHGDAQLEQAVAGQLKNTGAKPPAGVPANFESRPGFVNYHFNRLRRDAVLAACAGHGRWSGDSRLLLTGEAEDGEPIELDLGPSRAELRSEQGDYWVDTAAPLYDQLSPPESGGLLAALHLWRAAMAAEAPAALHAYGDLPWGDDGAMHNTLEFVAAGVNALLFFDPATGTLKAIELDAGQGEPCVVRFFGGDSAPSEGSPLNIVATRGEETVFRMRMTAIDEQPATDRNAIDTAAGGEE